MKKAEKMEIFDGVDIELLNSTRKNKEVTKLYMTGMTHKAIGERFGISASRVGQITNKMARIARVHRMWMENPERLSLIAHYREMIKSGGVVSIKNCAHIGWHFKALDEAHKQLNQEAAEAAATEPPK